VHSQSKFQYFIKCIIFCKIPFKESILQIQNSNATLAVGKVGELSKTCFDALKVGEIGNKAVSALGN
jgi:hypothetical protein